MASELQITFLHDRPDLAAEVARLWANEWGAGQGAFEKQLLSVKQKANKNQIPFILIGLFQGKLAVTASVFENDLDTMPTPEPWLAAVFTIPAYRGHQFAQQLVAAALDECKRLGHKRVLLRTETTAGYWRRLGWKFVADTTDEHSQPTTVFAHDL